MKKLLCPILLFFLSVTDLCSQSPIQVGKGSYAAYTPLYKCKTDEHSGDQSRKMEQRTLYITDENENKPIPSNDWWTDLLVSQYSGNMWVYPQVVNSEDYGIYVAYPREWNTEGTELALKTQLEVRAKGFQPESSLANNWHDWGLDFVMRDGDAEMKATIAHGMPFTWVESSNLKLQLRPANFNNIKYYDSNSNVLSLPYTATSIVIQLDDDTYGVYAPEGTIFETKGDYVEVNFSGDAQYISIAVLPDKSDLSAYSKYAYVIPRKTEVSWSYNETTGKIRSTWTITTENLMNKEDNDVLQGFIPHHYKGSQLDFEFTDYSYACPRGKMKMAAGNIFNIEYDFNGILPYFAAPKYDASVANPFNRDRMVQMISEYADKGSFGGDTYWGGKGLTQMALYMTFAHEMGETELFEKCKSKLKAALVNWYTFTPGEDNYFFARYKRWGSLIGYNTSYDSDTFNDHHFHYGYYIYASAVLALFDKDFADNYGEMASLLAKDYANWDKTDDNFPFLRTFDPWAGHSYAGGLGGWNGNGQESSSEAMQSWGGLYMLGVATGNKAMRDAGIFGWETESRATAEYWFDRDRENINYTNYHHPYCCNLTSQGVGWWTWFSGDPVWMHSIQWMPISPCLKYLYKDLEFAEWDYKTMWEGKEIGGYEVAEQGNYLSRESGLGNVVLTYLQISDADTTAKIFDDMWDGNMPVARNVDTGGITYYITHSHRNYGDICWDIHADVPTATAYLKNGKYTYMVYNPEKTEKVVNFYNAALIVKSFTAPAQRLTVYQDDAQATKIEIEQPKSNVVELGKTLQLNAVVLDQYGAKMENTISWEVSNGATISQEGFLTAGNTKTDVVVTASSEGLTSATLILNINDKIVLEFAQIQPQIEYLEVGNSISYYLDMKDQYGNKYESVVEWEISKDEVLLKTDSILDIQSIGLYKIKATVDEKSYETEIHLTPKFPNIALGKKAKASSYENTGTLVEYVNDGKANTRWGSVHSDPQWVYIDLKQSCYISYVTLLWETAYSSQFEIQVSENALDWTTITTQSGTGGTQTVKIDINARYIRMYGTQRATNYGHSMYEFEVYGIEPQGDTPALFGLDITPRNMQLKEGESVQLSVKGYDQFGNEMSINPTYLVTSGEGNVTANGLLTPSKYGSITISATSEAKSSSVTYLVEEQIKLKQIEISPKTSLLPVGKTQEFTCVATDQFGAEFESSSIGYYLKGDGARLIDNLFYADNVGDYEVSAGVGEIRDTATVSVSSLSDMNLAFNKPVISTGYENAGTLPEYVNDGDITTRWGSQHKDGQWIQFDLKDSYKLTSAEIYWETSSAAEYQLLVSKDGDDWVVAADKKNQPAGSRTDIIDLTQYQGRYLKINCIKRSNTYGFSIFEFRVYGSEIILSAENEEYQTNVEIYAKNGEINIITADKINNIGIYDLTGRCLSFINEIVGNKQVVLDRGHGIYIVRYQQNNVYYQTKIGF